jgi:hypothetical protein
MTRMIGSTVTVPGARDSIITQAYQQTRTGVRDVTIAAAGGGRPGGRGRQAGWTSAEPAVSVTPGSKIYGLPWPAGPAPIACLTTKCLNFILLQPKIRVSQCLCLSDRLDGHSCTRAALEKAPKRTCWDLENGKMYVYVFTRLRGVSKNDKNVFVFLFAPVPWSWRFVQKLDVPLLPHTRNCNQLGGPSFLLLSA